jgi:hypothetical protein
MSAPALAVVGCVNMGKSSIVASLVEDDAILIESEPGSTTRCASYDLRLGEHAVFTLIDTPGFQNARRALAWIEQHLRSNDEVSAPAAVRAFHREHRDRPAFSHEIQLLTPILENGAGILYVVNGTQPYLSRYEAEMRILAMTGAPRMAVINLHGEDSVHADAWEEALRPWFKVTRFDAHRAGSEARLGLFASLRGVDDSWAPVVDEALRRLAAEREARHDLAAASIAHLLIDALTMEERAPLETDRDAQTRRLSERLFDRLRERERKSRLEVETLYRHHRLERHEKALALVGTDLFNQDQWRILGLSSTQLASAGAAAGALAGGVLDASVGGASFLAGTLIGAAVGGAGAVWGGHGLAQVKVLGNRLGGKELRVTAPSGPRFPFVLLDRALVHWRLVAGRSHARRDALEVEPVQIEEGVVASAPKEVQNDLSKRFASLRKTGGVRDESERQALIRTLRRLGPRDGRSPSPQSALEPRRIDPPG